MSGLQRFGKFLELTAKKAMCAITTILAGVLIYFLNRKFAFRKTGLAPEQIHRLALSLAIFTAPYTMLIPISWIYY